MLTAGIKLLFEFDQIQRAWQFIDAVSLDSIIALIWLTLLVEIPRYFLGFQATAAAILLRGPGRLPPLEAQPKVSVLLAGHNEEHAIEKCVQSLHQQTYKNLEIICVDDGSTDHTFSIMTRLQHEGLVRAVARLDLRGGKAAGLNLAALLAKAEYFVVIDCDCSFEPTMIEELIRPLLIDPSLGAVSGNILVRNWRASLTTSLQAIEYLITISLGKAYANILDQVACVSGAVGAFKRAAWEHVGGMDAGGGEDLDVTIRLRLAGYRIEFARHAICYTDVPATFYALLKQRSRWERDAFWIRLRKHRRTINPFWSDFSWRDAVHQWDFILVNMAPALAFPFYLLWLVMWYGEFAWVILVGTGIVLLLFDMAVFTCAVLVTGQTVYWRLLAFLPLYGPFQSYVMRLHRIYAYITELAFSLSRKDQFVPQKVHQWSVWR